MTDTRQILYPPRLWFILLSLILALVADLLPSIGGPMRWSPDWLLITVLYWGLYQPRRVGFIVTFVCGLLMDVAIGQWLGQYALAYVSSLFLMLLLHRRLLMLTLWQQALHVGGLLLLSTSILAVIRLIAGGQMPGLSWFIPPLAGLLLWPLLTLILQLPQRRAPATHL